MLCEYITNIVENEMTTITGHHEQWIKLWEHKHIINLLPIVQGSFGFTQSNLVESTLVVKYFG